MILGFPPPFTKPRWAISFRRSTPKPATVQMVSFPSLTYAESQTEFSFCKTIGATVTEVATWMRVARTLKTTLRSRSLHKRSELLNSVLREFSVFFFFSNQWRPLRLQAYATEVPTWMRVSYMLKRTLRSQSLHKRSELLNRVLQVFFSNLVRRKISSATAKWKRMRKEAPDMK